jgi:predicted NACHT family NTPase
VLKGDGGMGKTVSLIRLWQAFTHEPQYMPGKPVPVFIQLNEINHWDKGSEGQGFIADQVNRFYLHRHEMTEKELVNLAKHPLVEGDKRIPALILLLDGFNEITREDKQRQLLLELRDLLEQCDGLQVVVSSRFDMRETMNWPDFHLLELLGMEEEKIIEILTDRLCMLVEPAL